jgi:hypothetical protein
MPQQHLTAEDWITRDDMAVLIRKSDYTIRRDERAHGLRTRVVAGRVLVNVGDFLRIERLRLEDLTAGATPAESAEVLRARQTITACSPRLVLVAGRGCCEARGRGRAGLAPHGRLTTSPPGARKSAG